MAVSYTHLDVYKRQFLRFPIMKTALILRFIMHLQMEQGQGIFFRSWYRII